MPVRDVVIAICVMAAVTFTTRALPFFLFSSKEKGVPELVQYLGKYLPPAIVCVILVYCFKDVEWMGFPSGLREIASLFVVFVLHCWKRNTMLSVFAGTICYMIMVRL